MGTNYTLILGDESWGNYADGYDGRRAFADIKQQFPWAELVGTWGCTIAVDIGKAAPIKAAEAARCDFAFYQSDNEPYRLERIKLPVPDRP